MLILFFAERKAQIYGNAIMLKISPTTNKMEAYIPIVGLNVPYIECSSAEKCRNHCTFKIGLVHTCILIDALPLDIPWLIHRLL